MKWTDNDARNMRAIARQLFKHGDWRHESDLERESCSACVLGGFLSASAIADGAKPEDGPNYAGWARVYVEAGVPVPEKWRAAFEAQRQSDNRAYAAALEASIETFGVKFA